MCGLLKNGKDDGKNKTKVSRKDECGILNILNPNN
jgi:hypothetical protein